MRNYYSEARIRYLEKRGVLRYGESAVATSGRSKNDFCNDEKEPRQMLCSICCSLGHVVT